MSYIGHIICSPHPHDYIFGSMVSNTLHKWHGNGIAIPSHIETKQNLKWAKVSTSQHSTPFTIFFIQNVLFKNTNWNTFSTSIIHTNLDIQIVDHVLRNTLKYYTTHPFPSYIYKTKEKAMSLICVH